MYILRMVMVVGLLVAPVSAMAGSQALVVHKGGAVGSAEEPQRTARNSTRQADSARQADRARTFILGNSMFTLYHEVGHALIHELQLPVLGREEDAVDNLASLMMVPEGDDPELFDMAVAAARGWLMTAAAAEDEEDDLAFWDEHGLDMQRYYSMVCMLYGSDPDRFGEMADSADLPEYRRDACPQEYEQVSASWATLLQPHMIADGGRKSTVRVVYDTPAPPYRHLVAMLKDSRMVEAIAEDVRTSFILPRALTLRVSACDEANAFFDPEDGSVTLCHELLEEFETLIRDDQRAGGR